MIAPIPDEGAGEQLYCIKAPGHSMPIGPGFVPAAKLRPAQALVAVDAFEAEYGLEISLARGPLMASLIASLIAHRHHVILEISLARDPLMASLMAHRHQVSASGCSRPRMMAATAQMIGVR